MKQQEVLYTCERKCKMKLRDLLTTQLLDLYPDMKAYLAQRYADKYTLAILSELIQALMRPDNDNDELSVSGLTLRDTCGRIQYQNQSIYLFEFMNRSQHTSLVIERFKGNNGKFKRVILNQQYKDQIMHELMETAPAEMTQGEREDLMINFNRLIPIDMVSLEGFLDKTRDSISLEPSGSNRYEKMLSNYHQARRLLSQVETHDGMAFVRELWVTSDNGREYGKYLSLQRMDKNVRHAALGVCHKYDFQAHSFAVMASLARLIDPTLKTAAIEEYIRYRDKIRAQLAQEVGVPESVIKTVFQSLGFGARPIANPYNSIRKVFYTQLKYEQFIANRTFQYIWEDLQAVNATLVGAFADDEFELFNQKTFHARDPEAKRKKTDSQRLAWIYQNCESYLTARMIEIVRERTGLEPLMTVHDCVYYKQRIPTEAFIDVQVILRQVENFEFVKLEHEHIFPITSQAVFDDRFAAQQHDEQQHCEQIIQEEFAARGYVGMANQPIAIAPPTTQILRRITAHTRANQPQVPDYEYEPESFR
jgi:hypothetical protein